MNVKEILEYYNLYEGPVYPSNEDIEIKTLTRLRNCGIISQTEMEEYLSEKSKRNER